MGTRVCSWDYYGDMFEVLMGARTRLCGYVFDFEGQVECQIFTYRIFYELINNLRKITVYVRFRNCTNTF